MYLMKKDIMEESMKEKTFNDLGLDEGDKYLNKISSEYDLGDLETILNSDSTEEELEENMRDIKEKI